MIMHSRKTIAVSPGATIKEQLNSRHMSQKEFAIRMDMSEKHISHLINGKVELTFDVAQRLESVLGIPAKVWSELELRYRERLARVQRELNDESESKLAQNFPYEQMVNNGWVDGAEDESTRLRNLRRFFEVANLNSLYNLSILKPNSNSHTLFNVAQEQAKKMNDKRN